MGKWNGTYDSTYESQRSLEDDIRAYAEEGTMCYPTSTGGTVRTDAEKGRIDVYGQSSSSKGHSHDWLSGSKTGHHD